jgi:hypothetical protein
VAISIICINCGARIKVPESAAGKLGKCSKCKQVIRVFETASLQAHVCDQCGKSLAREKQVHKVPGKVYCGECFAKIKSGSIELTDAVFEKVEGGARASAKKTRTTRKTRLLPKGQRKADIFLIRLLEERGVLKESDIDPLLEYQKQLGKRFIPLVRDINLISEDSIANAISETCGIERCPHGDLELAEDVEDTIDMKTMERYDVIALRREDDTLVVAMPNVLDISAFKALREALGLRIIPKVCTWSQYTKGRHLLKAKSEV